jgi:hypothetical protein
VFLPSLQVKKQEMSGAMVRLLPGETNHKAIVPGPPEAKPKHCEALPQRHPENIAAKIPASPGGLQDHLRCVLTAWHPLNKVQNDGSGENSFGGLVHLKLLNLMPRWYVDCTSSLIILIIWLKY